MDLFEKAEFHMSTDDAWFKQHQKVRQVKTWTSMNGSEALIMSLDSNHLKNIVAKIERGEHVEREDYLETMRAEVDYRYLLVQTTQLKEE